MDTGALADTGSNGDAATHDGSSDADAPDALGPAPVVLGTAANYVILAKSTITNAPTSMITGDLGLSPGTSITGLALTRAGTDWTSAQVIGSIFTVANDAPTPTVLGTAVLDMQAAYTDAAGRSNPTFLNLEAGAIGGLTLAPGLYTWGSAVSVPANVTIAGGPNDEWIFQVTGDLTMAATMSMILSGGAQAKNIVWQVAGSVTLGATSHAEGVVLCQTAITFGVGASIEGRLLAQTAVNIAGSIVTAPSP